MKSAFSLLLGFLVSAIQVDARNDWWLALNFSVSMKFGAADLGRTNAPWPKEVVPPHYPGGIVRASLEGEVVIDYTVDVDGSVSDVKVVRSTLKELSEAVTEAAEGWKFHPAIELSSGEPTVTRMRCRVRYTAVEEEEPNQSPEPTRVNARPANETSGPRGSS